MADAELAKKLARRQQLIEEKLELEQQQQQQDQPQNISSQQNGNGDFRRENLNLQLENQSKTSESSSIENLHSPISDGCSDELRNRLNRQQCLQEGQNNPQPYRAYGGMYAEFTEFTRKQLKTYEQMFKKYDLNRDGFICIDELKLMMEKLEAPQTHLALKQMIREVDEDCDNKINLREFLLIFRKAAAGELPESSGLSVFAQLTAIDVAQEGVSGAKNFFEAKIDQLTRSNAFEQEIRAEQEERRQLEEDKKARRAEFRNKKAVFQQS